jgi:hypothetical protein
MQCVVQIPLRSLGTVSAWNDALLSTTFPPPRSNHRGFFSGLTVMTLEQPKLINLLGEEYEPMMPGTKCPVSADRLRYEHMTKRRAVWDIHVWMQDEFNLIFDRKELLEWFSVAEIPVWTHEKDAVNINALRKTKCTATPLELWDMYVEKKKSPSEIAVEMAVHLTSVQVWIKKAKIPIRSLGQAMQLRGQKQDYKDKLRECRFKSMEDPMTFNQMMEGLKKARQSSALNNYKSVKIPCAQCGKIIMRQPSRLKHANSFCSKSCLAKFVNKTPGLGIRRAESRSKSAAINGLICPHCKHPRMVKSGRCKYRKFRCSVCRHITIRPIIEFGLRQDLEAAGALDDDRILASAFSDTAPQDSGVRVEEGTDTND